MWQNRAVLERESEARFARLAGRLTRSGATGRVVAMTEAAAHDEARHAEICASTAAHFGGAVALRRPPEEEVSEVAPANLAPVQRVLYEVVATCCLAESVNACYLSESLSQAREPVTRAALRHLLGDEIRHGQLGWAHLAASRGQGIDPAFLGPLVPRMLGGAVAETLFRPDEEDVDAPEVGVLSRSARRGLIVGALTEVVFPGLAAFGVDPEQGMTWVGERLSWGRREGKG